MREVGCKIPKLPNAPNLSLPTTFKTQILASGVGKQALKSGCRSQDLIQILQRGAVAELLLELLACSRVLRSQKPKFSALDVTGANSEKACFRRKALKQQHGTRLRSSAWYAKTCDVTKSLGRLWLLHLLSICDDPPTSSCSSYTTAKATITTATTNTKNNDDDDADDDDRNNVNAAAAAPVAQRDRACLSRSCRSGPKAVFGLQHVGLSLPESLLSRTKTLERRPWLWLRSLWARADSALFARPDALQSQAP